MGIFRKIPVFLMVLIGLALAGAGSVSAQAIAEGAACSEDVKNAMEQAGWLSGQRTLEFSEQILQKPDSVLQYSCFNSYQTDDTLTEGLADYIQRNFATAAAGGSLCARMDTIWQAQKCQNFDKAWFRTFGEMAASDPRTFYKACNSAARNAAWTNALEEAYPPPGEPGGVDTLVTHNDMLYMRSSNACADSLLVPTGLTTSGGEADGVCTKPGCYYDGNGCSN